MIKRKELIQKYLNFFESKSHKIIPSASLIPINDPTVLFITAGMQPLVPYLLGKPHPLGKRIANRQRCLRTDDIEEVGDTYHHTFFEMLGNWSLGDYFKKESIEMSFEFLTKELKIPIEKLAVTVFGGDKNFPKIPEDKESAEIWKSLGIPEEKIAFMPGGVKESEDNWWGPAGKTGPCGPSTEIFYWKPKNKKTPNKFDPDDENWVEIWNNVLMEYEKDSEGNFLKAKQKNIDTGMGVERTLAALNNYEDDYEAEAFRKIIEKIEEISGKEYSKNQRSMRIISDHIKASVIIISDGITPSNKDQGYILRRLIRRAIRYGKNLNIENFTQKIAEPVFEIYSDYENLPNSKDVVMTELEKEEEKFNETLEKGLKKFEEFSMQKEISGKEAFLLYQSYGFPLEMTLELSDEKRIDVDTEEFEKELKKHQELSRTAAKGKFSSGLADHSEKTTRLHTATHLLNEALRQVLGDEVKQRGSNINPERLRFDFKFPRKLTEEEKKKIEELVNEKIRQGLEVKSEEMSLKEAKEQGAQSEFGHKYPPRVSVYTIYDPNDERGWFSKEICTGPHVKNTKEIGRFKIKKEESSSSGIRRIKGVVEDSSVSD